MSKIYSWQIVTPTNLAEQVAQFSKVALLHLDSFFLPSFAGFLVALAVGDDVQQARVHLVPELLL